MEDCIICKEAYNEEKIPFELDCTHTFCKFCILDMFKRDNRCPLCRTEFIFTINQDTNKFVSQIPAFIQVAMNRLPTGPTSEVVKQIEMLTYRIYRKVYRITNIVYSPSFQIIINDNSKLIFNLHSIVLILTSVIMWLLIYYFI